MLSRFSSVWLCATLWTAAHQAPLSIGFSRQEYWSELPFPSLRMALGQALFQYDCVLREMKNLDKEKEACTQKSTSGDNRELEGCIQKPGNTGDCQEITRSLKWKGMIHLHPSEEWPCQHLDFGFIDPRTMTQYIGLAKFSFIFFHNILWKNKHFGQPNISVVLRLQVNGTLLQSSRKLSHPNSTLFKRHESFTEDDYAHNQQTYYNVFRNQ